MKDTQLIDWLTYLKLAYFRDNHDQLAQQAAQKSWSHLDYLNRLVEGETHSRQDRATQRRIRVAGFPVIKTFEEFNWTWPTKINRAQIQHLFTLSFLKEHTNVVFMGRTGIGKSHLATALAYQACLHGNNVLFTTAMDMVNTLNAAQASNRLKSEIKKYLKPQLLFIDELGYLPIDKIGADLIFQVLSQRYEKGSTLITTNQAYKNWIKTFNNDASLTSALLDRLLHHVQTIRIEGKSYRMKDQIEEP